MILYHLLYILKDGTFVSTEKEFGSFSRAEDWLSGEGAIYWEIGIAND